MGQLVEGVWKNVWYDTKSTGGRFKRTTTAFRNWLTADGSKGPEGQQGIKAEKDRYHLYVSYACPWAHRVLIARSLKGLEDLIGVSVVNPLMLENGWSFDKGFPDSTGDKLHPDNKYLYQLYTMADKEYTGRVTVPVLWDKKEQTIVNNESSELIRMLNTAFDHLGAKPGNYYPDELKSEIDEVNSWVYDNINNGVYKAGFATTQEAYEEAIYPLFKYLEKVEEILSKQRYLTGPVFTEADIRLWTTLVRFDHVYVTHFKCDRKRIVEYPNISGYLREIYQMPGIKETVNMPHIRNHYFRSHPTINPYGILPLGPVCDWTQDSNREKFPAKKLTNL